MVIENLHLGASGDIFNTARSLRKNETEAEKVLWSVLRGGKLGGHKFRRQHPVNHWIADFYCHKAKLVIEVDGPVHDLKLQRESDDGRTFELEQLGVKVIRFRNEKVLNDLNGVLDEIRKHLNPGPSPQGEGKNKKM